MSRKRLALLTVAVALLCVGIVTNTSLVFDYSETTKRSGEAHPADRPSFGVAPAPEKDNAPTETRPTETPENPSLLDRFEALRGDENLRDAQALETLLDELYTCRTVPQSERALDRYTMNARQQMITLESEQQREDLARYLRSVETCAQYTPALFASALDWVEQLADSGDLNAQLLYLIAAGPGDWQWQLDPQKLTEFGARIARYYEAATLEPISADAFEFLSELHQTSYLGPPDEVLSFAYRFAMLRSSGQDDEAILDRAMMFLDEDQLDAAELIASELLEACCS